MNIRYHLQLFRRSIHSLPHYQKAVGRLRLLWFVRVRRQLRLGSSESAFETTISHNLKSLNHFNQRTDALLKPLSVIETLGPESKLLIVGPRNEGDLYSAIGYGFEPRNVRGLDLISYSPRIDVGDMHRTDYSDNAFDAVVVGWTLSYSADPPAFAREMIRIVRDGGVIAIGVEYATMSEEDEVALGGYTIQERDRLAERINSTAQILALFQGFVDHIYFNHDAPAKRSHSRHGMIAEASKVLVVFSIRKPAGTTARTASATPGSDNRA